MKGLSDSQESMQKVSLSLVSPSTTLVSKEIETNFSSSFFQKARKVPEVADLTIVCGGGVAVADFV